MLREGENERRRVDYHRNKVNRAKHRARSNMENWIKAGGMKKVEVEIRDDARNAIDEWKRKQQGAPELIAQTAAEVMYAERKAGLKARRWVMEEIDKKAEDDYEGMVIFKNVYIVVKELIKEIR